MTLQSITNQMRPITLQDKETFRKYLSAFPCDICVYTFPFMLAWSITRRHKFCEYKKHLLISYETNERDVAWYMPIGPDPASIISELPPLSGFQWRYISEPLAKQLEKQYKLEWEKDYFDYVYETKDLAGLPGEKFAEKRTFVRRCLKFHPEIVRLSSGLKDECVDAHVRWSQSQKDPEQGSLLEERKTLEECLSLFEELQLWGVGVRICGRMEAFAMGAFIHEKMLVEDFEKATGAYPGLYAFVLNALAKSLPEKCLYLNREADLGIPGLRMAKQRWHPTALVRRYFTIRSLDSWRPFPEAKQ